MNFYDYIGIDKETFLRDYVDARLVSRQEHPEFPLSILTYSRTAVHDNVWDGVTNKCRGIIIHRETGEIIARPFEKFFNYGSAEAVPDSTLAFMGQPVVWEKLDGFLCTLYHWKGQNYIASKGSFTSPHAKWATAWIQKVQGMWAVGYTPVFEGLTPNLRIVVDYGEREGLLLTAVINNETGEEVNPYTLEEFARRVGIKCANKFNMTWQQAVRDALDAEVKNEEGYVLTWYRKDQTPYRLKVKFQDYLRLHRLVIGVGPKRVLEALMNGWTTDLDGMLNESTPWFSKYVAKWKTVIENEYSRLSGLSHGSFHTCQQVMRVLQSTGSLEGGNFPTRKEWAEMFQRPEHNEVKACLFALLDGKDVSTVIWKMVKNSDLLKNGRPMVDMHNL